MQKSVIGIYKTKQGFTLLELLIVLVIISIVVAATALTLGTRSHDQTWRSDANILRSQIQLAQQQAIFTNQTYGLAISNKAYAFMLYQEVDNKYQWQTITQQAGLRSKQWIDTDSVNLQMNNNTISLDADDSSPTPQIIFYPSGQISPFILRLNDHYILQTSANNSITLGTIDEN